MISLHNRSSIKRYQLKYIYILYVFVYYIYIKNFEILLCLLALVCLVWFPMISYIFFFIYKYMLAYLLMCSWFKIRNVNQKYLLALEILAFEIFWKFQAPGAQLALLRWRAISYALDIDDFRNIFEGYISRKQVGYFSKIFRIFYQ